MLESTYLSALSSEIEKEFGGKVIKISDRSTLGLPDSMYIKDGVIVYIESKIDDHVVLDESAKVFVQPWRVIQKQEDGLRQFEVCRSIAKHSLVVYAIYYPNHRCSVIMPVEVMAEFRPTPTGLPYLNSITYLNYGKGITQLKGLLAFNRKVVHGRLSSSI